MNETACQRAPVAASSEDTAPSRRSLFTALIYGLWSLIGAALAAPAGVYLFFPPRVKKPEEWVEAADLSRIGVNDPEEVVFRRNRVDGWKVASEKASAWIVKVSETEAIAFEPHCTHLGCAYHWDQQKKHFVCPCHTSAFSIDGRVLFGPAPRALDRHEVKIAGGKLLVGGVQQHHEE